MREREREMEINVTTYDGYPAINIKCYGFYGFDKVETTQEAINEAGRANELTPEMLNYLSNEDFQWYWDQCAESEIDHLQEWANDKNGPFEGCYDVNLHTAGRSGGWLIVVGLPDLDEWNDELKASWQEFKQGVTSNLDAFPSIVREEIIINVSHLLLNHFQV